MNVTVATPQDINAIQAFAQIVFSHHIADERKRTRLLERVYSPVSLQRSISNTSANLVVARDGCAVVGLMHFGSPLLEECEDRKEVHRLLVHPTFTRRGVGGQLLAAMHTVYKLEDVVQQFFVCVPASDAILTAFYRKYGFWHDQTRDKDSDHYYVRAK